MNAACSGYGELPSIARSNARSMAFAVGDSEGFTLCAMQRLSPCSRREPQRSRPASVVDADGCIATVVIDGADHRVVHDLAAVGRELHDDASADVIVEHVALVHAH